MMASSARRTTLSLTDGIRQSRRESGLAPAARMESTPARKLSSDDMGLSVLSALNLLKWKNNSVKPKMLGFKELKRKISKAKDDAPTEINKNVFELREYYSRRW